MTDEEKVKSRWPQAWAESHDWSLGRLWFIWSQPWNTTQNVADSRWLGHGITEHAAWQDAATQMEASQAPLTDSYYHSRFWPSLEAAQQACEEHARRYTPKPHTVKRAQELLESFLTPA